MRDAALELMLSVCAQKPTPVHLAEATGLPVSLVDTLTGDDDAFYTLLLQPFAEAIDDELKRLPLHPAPTLADQRQILNAMIDGLLRTPKQVALIGLLLADKEHQPHRHKMDRFAYQAGLRLLGAEYDEDRDQMTRVYFASEFLLIAALSRRHDLHDPRERGLVIESTLALLHPAGTFTAPPAADPPTSAGAGRHGRADQSLRYG